MLVIEILQACSKPQKEMKKIIYVMDPQCGWCYGNSKNIKAIYDTFKELVTIEMVVGGMWLHPNAPKGGDHLSLFIETHAPQMERTTGIAIGSGYYELIKDSTYVFSSLEPSAAIVLVKDISPELAIIFAEDIQKALYTEGKILNKLSTFAPILEKHAIDMDVFKNQWLSEDNLKKTYAEFKKASSLAKGFPTLIFQDKNTSKILASGYFNLENMMSTLYELYELER